MTAAEQASAFVPIETLALPRPLSRFGTAFPLAVAEAYTEAHTADRGVVLDPLAHPWSAADAAERAGRRGIGRSLQPLGSWARAVVAAAPPAEQILAGLERLGEAALAGPPHAVAMRELYGARCDTCRGPVTVEAYLWERDAQLPTKKAFRCRICAREGRALLIEPSSAEDEQRTRALDPRGLAYWQFVERFPQAERELAESLAALYTPRNLAALMATLRAVETAELAKEVRDVLLLCLIEPLVGGSRLNAVAGQGATLRIEKGRARRGHAAQSREINVWLEYERTVRELASWLATNPPVQRPARALPGADAMPADLVLFEAPADDPLGGWSYVATVLCLGAAAARSPDSADARVSARERTLRATRLALIEARPASRDDAPAVIYLRGADLGGLAACALGAAGAGYRLRSITYQRDALAPGRRGTSGAAAILELEREATRLKDQLSADAASIEEAIRSGVREALVARGEPLHADRAAAAALEALARRGLLPALSIARAGGVSELELFVDHFRSALGDGHRAGIERLRTAESERSEGQVFALSADPGEIVPLDDRVEWGTWGLLSSGHEIETRSALRRAYALFRGIETPDRELVERCLASYAVQGDDGRWRLREQDRLQHRQQDQSLLIAQLAETGRRLGFKVHIGQDLRRRPMPEAYAERGHVLADLLTEDERAISPARYVRGPREALEYVDCLWYDRGGMTFLWQADWTARLHRSVLALGEAIPDDDRVFRFLAVADERRDLVGLKLSRSSQLADVVRRRAWRFVKWGALRRFAADEAAGLEALEPILGLEPAVEQAGQQLAFRW
ncbi:MAG TPA: hypothetical protein VMJ92_03725 [Candidatus Limnocylindrales bacterium]|nr:hypothetical protein [Candidatus Limnocylindrales bacterium]